MNATENRKKETKEMEKVKTPDETYSKQIVRLITETFKKKHKVYLMTDLHLFVRDDKGKLTCHHRANFKDILKNYTDVVNAKDLVIFMGDLVHGEFQEKEQLRDIMLALPGRKVLVRGNNDLFSYEFYRSCGFAYITREFIWNQIVFTHVPINLPKNCLMNVHGHIHNFKTYYVPYNNHIDVAYVGGREKPVELNAVLDAQKEYSKHIKECPEHFNEYAEMNYSAFDLALMSAGVYPFIPDPYTD